ncbi:hypothetical protein BaRGS_00017415, partial [Batillaria attramentaria]
CGSDRELTLGDEVCCGSRCGPVCKDKGQLHHMCQRDLVLSSSRNVSPDWSDWAGNVGPYGSVGPCTYQCKPPVTATVGGNLKMLPQPLWRVILRSSQCKPAPTCENV